MEYTFQITPMDVEALLPQVSRALEMRTELASREKCPGLWKVTDRLRRTPRVSGAASQKRRNRRKVLGTLCLVLGVVAFVPGLAAPLDLSLLLAGAVGIIAGLVSLLGGGRRKNPFEESAGKLLAGKDRIPAGQSLKAVFSPEGMTLFSGGTETGVREETVSYGDLTGVIECGDVFLITYEERAAVFQKGDLTGGNVDDFRVFLAGRAPYARCDMEDSLYRN